VNSRPGIFIEDREVHFDPRRSVVRMTRIAYDFTTTDKEELATCGYFRSKGGISIERFFASRKWLSTAADSEDIVSALPKR